jgi:lipoprotein
MKNFNIILIACLAFIFLSSSGCSKEEDSPYTREQIIGKWNQKSYWKTDESGNGDWVNYPDPNLYYYQFNENGTFYIYNVQDNTNSSWELKGKRINCKTTRYWSSTIRYYNFEIISINRDELIMNYQIDNGHINRGIFIKDTTQEK